MTDTERFPKVETLPPALVEIIQFLKADDWWCVMNDDETQFEVKRFPDEEWEDIATKEVVNPVLAIICKHRGHDMESDQCGRVEHDYCIVCGQRRDQMDKRLS